MLAASEPSSRVSTGIFRCHRPVVPTAARSGPGRAVVVKTMGIRFSRAAASNAWVAGMISSMLSQVKA